MSHQKDVEIAVWSDRECTKQIVEFDLPETVCEKLDLFLSSINDYLIDCEWIEDIDSHPLTNLEFSPVTVITASKEVICDHYSVNRETKELEKVLSRPKSMIIYTRKIDK